MYINIRNHQQNAVLENGGSCRYLNWQCKPFLNIPKGSTFFKKIKVFCALIHHYGWNLNHHNLQSKQKAKEWSESTTLVAKRVCASKTTKKVNDISFLGCYRIFLWIIFKSEKLSTLRIIANFWIGLDIVTWLYFIVTMQMLKTLF